MWFQKWKLLPWQDILLSESCIYNPCLTQTTAELSGLLYDPGIAVLKSCSACWRRLQCYRTVPTWHSVDLKLMGIIERPKWQSMAVILTGYGLRCLMITLGGLHLCWCHAVLLTRWSFCAGADCKCWQRRKHLSGRMDIICKVSINSVTTNLKVLVPPICTHSQLVKVEVTSQLPRCTFSMLCNITKSLVCSHLPYLCLSP